MKTNSHINRQPTDEDTSKGGGRALPKRAKAALEGKLKTLQELEARATRDECATRYAMGLEIEDVRTAKDGTYGEGAIATLAAALGRDPNTLYEYGDVAKTWSKDEFEALCSRSAPGGTRLTFSHFIALTKAPGVQRAALLARAATERLSVRDIRAAIRAGLTTESRESVTPPATTLDDFRDQCVALAERLHRLCQGGLGMLSPDQEARALEHLRRLRELLLATAELVAPTPLAKVPSKTDAPVAQVA